MTAEKKGKPTKRSKFKQYKITWTPKQMRLYVDGKRKKNPISPAVWVQKSAPISEWPQAFDGKFDKPAPKRKPWSPSTLAVNSAERAYIAAWKRLGMDMREALKEAIAAAAKVDGIGK